LELAREQGYCTCFLGPAVSVPRLVSVLQKEQSAIVGLSYRLTPDACGRVLDELRSAIISSGLDNRHVFIFGGTPPVVRVAREKGWFAAAFDGTEGVEGVMAFLKGHAPAEERSEYPQTLAGRLAASSGPLFRHHFGLPSLADTIGGVARLAESGVLDVISLAPDQNAQQSFFRPAEMDPAQDGAGGVPIRQREHLVDIYKASRCGNFPLLRCYSGTRDLLLMAEMLRDTINLAWGAVPLFWYNVLDGRSQRPLAQSLSEAQAAMAWHAQQGIPLEVNEAHHWSLRGSTDGVAVAAAFLAAYNAKKHGVKQYVAQYMLHTPPGTDPTMDLAKMLAKIDMIEGLHDEGFTTWRQTRAGLASIPLNMAKAKGHLAASSVIQSALKPHIVHVVAYCEAHHAATPEDIIESVQLVKGALALGGHIADALLSSERVLHRRAELLADARDVLNAIRELAPRNVVDPWVDVPTLCSAVQCGILDAPQLAGNPVARGEMVARMVDGSCRPVDPVSGRVITEKERVARLMQEALAVNH